MHDVLARFVVEVVAPIVALVVGAVGNVVAPSRSALLEGYVVAVPATERPDQACPPLHAGQPQPIPTDGQPLLEGGLRDPGAGEHRDQAGECVAPPHAANGGTRK